MIIARDVMCCLCCMEGRKGVRRSKDETGKDLNTRHLN